jgi:hypothetical protein
MEGVGAVREPGSVPTGGAGQLRHGSSESTRPFKRGNWSRAAIGQEPQLALAPSHIRAHHTDPPTRPQNASGVGVVLVVCSLTAPFLSSNRRRRGDFRKRHSSSNGRASATQVVFDHSCCPRANRIPRQGHRQDRSNSSRGLARSLSFSQRILRPSLLSYAFEA